MFSDVPLATGDLGLAQRCARAVSERGGGLGAVEAAGLPHGEGGVEVACNLCCDAVVSLLLLQDWVATISTDVRLRLSLMDLKAGRLKVADLQEQSKKEE